MINTLLIAIRATVVTLVVTGLLYPVAMTGIAQVLFPHQANGSLLIGNGGTRRLGAPRTELHVARLLPAPAVGGGREGYDAASSSGSNLGPTSKKLRDRMTADVERLREQPRRGRSGAGRARHHLGQRPGPASLAAGALWQVPRVARARGVSAERVRASSTRTPRAARSAPRRAARQRAAPQPRPGPPVRSCVVTGMS